MSAPTFTGVSSRDLRIREQDLREALARKEHDPEARLQEIEAELERRRREDAARAEIENARRAEAKKVYREAQADALLAALTFHQAARRAQEARTALHGSPLGAPAPDPVASRMEPLKAFIENLRSDTSTDLLDRPEPVRVLKGRSNALRLLFAELREDALGDKW